MHAFQVTGAQEDRKHKNCKNNKEPDDRFKLKCVFFFTVNKSINPLQDEI